MSNDPLKSPLSMPNPAPNNYVEPPSSNAGRTAATKNVGAQHAAPHVRTIKRIIAIRFFFASSSTSPSTTYAEAAFPPLKAGTNTSPTNVSIAVGVVFSAVRGSSAFIRPSFIASHISTMISP